MRSLPADWWRLSDDELRECEIGAQPECVECNGVCCHPEHLWIEIAQGTTLQAAPKAVAAEGYEAVEVLALKYRPEERRCFAQIRCMYQGDGPCLAPRKPDACLWFPINFLTSSEPEEDREFIRTYCGLLRRLERERIEVPC